MCGIVAFQLVTAGAHSGLVLQQLLYGFQSVPVPELYWADQGAATHVAQTSLYLVNVCHIHMVIRFMSTSKFDLIESDCGQRLGTFLHLSRWSIPYPWCDRCGASTLSAIRISWFLFHMYVDLGLCPRNYLRYTNMK